VVGYRPSNTNLDGTYRRIEVKVTAEGVRVRARRGYLALEPARMLTPPPAAGARPSTPSVPATAGSTPPPESNVTPATVPDPAAGAGAGTARAPAEAAPPAGATPPAPPLPPPAGPRKNAAEMVLALADGAAGVQVTGSRAAEGWAAYQRGDLESAAAILQQAVGSGDARPWVYYALGFAELAEGRTAASVAAWEKVRAAAPDFQAVYYDLADAYTQLGDEKMAVLVLRDAERRWPSEPDLFNAMGVIQLRRGALDDAIGSFQNAVKVAPQDALGYFNLGRAHQIRYAASLRYVEAIGRHVGNDRDRERAIANLEKYVSLGGPYVTQAREALTALAWK
jgi:tetratricopeptide (TPR) repeat protein